MGLSTSESSSVTYIKMVGLKQESPQAYFSKVIKKDGQWTTEGEFANLEGQLKSIKFEAKETEKWGTIHSAKLEIVDDQTYVFDCPLGTGIGRSIINSIAGATDKIDLIKIGLYVKDSYKKVSVYINGERANWALSIDEQKALTTKIEDPDTGEVIKVKVEKLIAKLKEVCNPECNADAKPRVSFEQASNALDEQMNASFSTPEEEEESSDLPF